MSATASVARYGQSPSVGAGSEVGAGAAAVIVLPGTVEVMVDGDAVTVPTVLVTGAAVVAVVPESADPEQAASNSAAAGPTTMGSARTALIDDRSSEVMPVSG
jgi:hypothetical protein